MSVLIRGMDMPKTCKECVFSRYILGEWFCRTTTTLDDDGTELWESVGENGNSQRADFCPLVPVPPHGRLIDGDALRQDWLENGENEYVYDTNAFLDSLDNTPTIIPAEEEPAEDINVPGTYDILYEEGGPDTR